MEKKEIEQIRFCSFCPNICRIAYPEVGIPQIETLTLSTISYFCYLLMNRYIDYTKEVLFAFQNLKSVISCKQACPYGFDIPRLVEEWALELKRPKV